MDWEKVRVQGAANQQQHPTPTCEQGNASSAAMARFEQRAAAKAGSERGSESGLTFTAAIDICRLRRDA